MKPDSMLVEPEFIVEARQKVAGSGGSEALDVLGQTEPALAYFIGESLATVAGKLALSGAPTLLVQGSHEDMLALVLTCVEALRRGHFELWKDTMTGTGLAELDGTSQATTKRRRKKRNGAGPTE